MDNKILSMATLPEREQVRKIAHRSLRGQVDIGWIFEGTGPKGDAAKFKGVTGREGYLFTADDDIKYPPGYIDYLIEKIEQYGRKAVISLHGKIIKNQPVKSFYGDDFIKLRCMDAVESDRRVHLPGTGVMGWHSSTIQFSMDDFKEPNMADIWAGIKCEREGVPRVCVAHEGGYLKNLDRGGPSCYRDNRTRDHILTAAINSITWKQVY